jgi:hypothetical protein
MVAATPSMTVIQIKGIAFRFEDDDYKRAWLEFRVEPIDGAASRRSQTALFAPRGLTGLLYWHLLYPIHAVIFSGLAKKRALLAEEVAGKR